MTAKEQSIEKLVDTLSESILSILVVVVTVIVTALILMFAWNYVIPFLFHLPELSFLKAFALSIVSNVLFKPNGNLASLKK